MKAILRTGFLFLAGVCFSVLYAHAQAATADKSLAPAVFVASTPCSPGTKPLPGIPRDAGCELIKWELQIFGDTGKHTSGTYILDCTYGMPKQGTRGFINGGSRLQLEGKWVTIKSTATNPGAIIYRLETGKSGAPVSFLRLNENLLHLLDSRDQLMIGTGAWSYTLTKIR